MKKRSISIFVKSITLILASVMLLLSVSACSGKGKSLITLDKDGYKVSFSVNHYDFLLSRWKGVLATESYSQNGVSYVQDSFFDQKDKFNGTDFQTLGEYYADLTLENSKTYTAVLWLFESMGLSLSKEQTDQIDADLKEILEAYDGSKTKLNAELSQYGVNYKLLREMYLMEMKVSAVKNALYGSEGSLLGDTIKDEYLNEAYVRFKQIFIPYFKYVYRTDANGEEIYYVKDTTTGEIAYDIKNGYLGVDENGLPITDANGDDVYYTTQTDQKYIAYDKVNGIRSYELDNNGEAKTTDMTADEIAKEAQKGQELFASLAGCTVAQFEAAIAEHNADGGTEIYTDGYYLQKTLDYAAMGSDVAYFSDIIKSFEDMQAGEIAEITSDAAGYHIIMKYDPTPKAYDLAANEVWFKNFISGLVQELFMEECENLFDDMVVNEKVLATVSDIRKIGANTDF